MKQTVAQEVMDANSKVSLGSLSDRLPTTLHESFLGIELWQYLALSLLVGASLLARKLIHYIVLVRVRRLAEVLGQAWMMRLVDVCASPGATLVMALLLRLSYPALDLPPAANETMAGLVQILISTGITWAVYLSVDVLASRFAEKAASTESKLDDQLVPLLRKTLKVVTIVCGGLFVLQNMDVDVGSLLAGLGIGGLAFALAAKDTIANFFGSLMIFVDRPFQIGDWIQVGQAEGVVEEVGFRSTRIRTFYNSIITLPNATFTEKQIDNYGVREYRRTSVTLNLTYDTTSEQMQAFVEGVRAVIAANEFTRKDYYEVHMSGFGPYSLDVMLYFFFKVDSWTDELRERHNVYLEIMRLAQHLGVQFAFPTQTLQVDSLAQPGKEKTLPSPLPKDELEQVVLDFGPGGKSSRPATVPIAPRASTPH